MMREISSPTSCVQDFNSHEVIMTGGLANRVAGNVGIVLIRADGKHGALVGAVVENGGELVRLQIVEYGVHGHCDCVLAVQALILRCCVS